MVDESRINKSEKSNTFNSAAAAAKESLSALAGETVDKSNNTSSSTGESTNDTPSERLPASFLGSSQDELSRKGGAGAEKADGDEQNPSASGEVSASKDSSVRGQGNLRGTNRAADKAAAVAAAQEAATAAAQAVSAAESAAAAAWGNPDTGSNALSSNSSNSKANAPADIASLLFPNWDTMRAPGEIEGTQVFIENDGTIRLDVHPSASRMGRGRRGGQQVLSPFGDELYGYGDPFGSFAQQRHELRQIPRAAPQVGGSTATGVAMEELLLLEKLQATGVDSGLRAHLEEALQNQVHRLGSSAGGAGFVETEGNDSSGVASQNAIQGYLAAFGFGFGGILLISIIICCLRALYVRHMKKKLEAQVSALGLTSEERAAEEAAEREREEGWVDVSVEEHKPTITEQIQQLASQASRFVSRQPTKAESGSQTLTGRQKEGMPQERKKIKIKLRDIDDEEDKGKKHKDKKEKKEKTEKEAKAKKEKKEKKDKEKKKKAKKEEKDKERKDKDRETEGEDGRKEKDKTDEEKGAKKLRRKDKREKELMKILSSKRTLKLG